MKNYEQIKGALYERVPQPTGRCTGCAFYTPDDEDLHCQALGEDVSCTQPEPVIFTPVGPTTEPDEQCGVGNG